MTQEELKIEEAAKIESGYTIKTFLKIWINGAKSEAAKEYHTKGLYTPEEVLEIIWKSREVYTNFKDTPFKYLKLNVINWFNISKKK